MKLLLTSAGVKNASIRGALVDLLGKPIGESSALCIPTGMYGSVHRPRMACEGAWRFITGRSTEPMCELGWKSIGVLELTALPSVDEERWVPLVEDSDVLLVSGGDALYLCHWMRAVRAGRPLAVAPRDGLGRAERREHGDDPQDRGGLRRLEAANRCRRDAGARSVRNIRETEQRLSGTFRPCWT